MIKIAHIDSMVNDLLSMAKDIVIKRDNLANKTETLDIIRFADYYTLAIDNQDSFWTYIKYDEVVLREAGLTEEEIENALLSKANIPDDKQSIVFEVQHRKILSSYVEKNDYYRELNGLPPYNEKSFVYVNGTYPGIDRTTPIHTMTDEQIKLLRAYGVIDQLIEQYPNKKYLKFLGSKKIDIFTARKAKNFDILQLGVVNNESIKNEFIKNYEYAKRSTLQRDYHPKLFGNQDDYDSIIGFLILNQAIQLTLDSNIDVLNNRTYYDQDTISNILSSYALNIFNDIPLKFRKTISDNIAILRKYKGTDKVFSLIYNIFGFDEVEVYKYFIVKERKRDNLGNPTAGPNLNDMYGLNMAAVSINSKNIAMDIRNPENFVDYDNIVNKDPFWGVYETNESIKNKLLEYDFNYLDTKYISINTAYDVSKMNYEISYLMSSLLSFKQYENALMVPLLSVQSLVPLFDLFVYIFAMISKQLGYDGNIPASMSAVASIYRFNFEYNIDKLNEIYNTYSKARNYIDINSISLKQPVNDIPSQNELMNFFFNNTNIYNILTNAMNNAKTKDEYQLAKTLFNYLTTSKQSTNIYTKSNGSVATTYYDYLLDSQPMLAVIVDTTPKNELEEKINDALKAIEEFINSDKLQYMFTKIPSTNDTLIKSYISKIINTFKSYTIDIATMNMIYRLDDEKLNKLRFFDDNSFAESLNNNDISRCSATIGISETISSKDNFIITDEIDIIENIKPQQLNIPSPSLALNPYNSIENIEIARNSPSINPLKTFNFVGASESIVDNNNLITHGVETEIKLPDDDVRPKMLLSMYGSKIINGLYPTGKDETIISGKPYFIGGNTVSYEMSFSGKVARSTVECPLKIYTQEVDLANLPNPATGWTEITQQSILDKLKTQNELPITASSTTSKTATWNGKNFVVQSNSTPAIRDDFAGKTSGNTTVCPNIAKYTKNSSLVVPTGIFTELSNSDWNAYNKIFQLDANVFGYIAAVNNEIPQQIFSFDIRRMFKDKYGNIPSDGTVAGDIAWLKANIKSITANWHGYGSCPSGNKAYFDVFSLLWNSWFYNKDGSSNGKSNSTASPACIEIIRYNGTGSIPGQLTNILDPNGFVHFLAYTNPASTTNDKLLVLSNHGLSLYDIIENTTRGVESVINGLSVNSVVHSTIEGQQIGDIIKKFHAMSTTTTETGTTETTIKVTNHGLSTGDWTKILANSLWNNRKVTVVDGNTFTINAITGLTSGVTIQLLKYAGTQTAESTVIPSTIYTDYISLDIQVKDTVGYDTLVSDNPRRDAGLGNIILLKKDYTNIVSDFAGKLSGSVVENPNIFKGGVYDTTLNIPSSSKWAEASQQNYSDISTNNATIIANIRNNTGEIAQQLFSFDLIRIFEDKYGPIPSANDAASKAAWLKDNVNTVTYSWTGYGSCPNGSKANFSYWNGSSWVSVKNNNTSTPTLITNNFNSTENNANIQSDGFIHGLAYTDPSDGVTPSIIYTDYIKLDITFKNQGTSIEYFTNNSVELETITNAKAMAYMIEADVSAITNSSLYGGSNSALKNGLKSIIAEIWARGQGSNSGALVNGVRCELYDNSLNKFEGYGDNNGASIIKITPSTINPTKISTSNKIYLLIHSTNPSDGTIPSQVNLDYLSIKLDFYQAPTVVNPIPVTLPVSGNFAGLVEGFSPAWDNTRNDKTLRIATFYRDDSNRINLYWYYPSKTIYLKQVVNGVEKQSTQTPSTFNKFQVSNYLIQQTDTTLSLFILKNNGTLEKYTTPITNKLSGLVSFYPLTDNTNVYQADAFAEFFHLIDLTDNPNGFTDAEAQLMLSGVPIPQDKQEMLSNGDFMLGNELVINGGFDTDTAWTKHANAVISGGKLILNATDTNQNSTQEITVESNSVYILQYDKFDNGQQIAISFRNNTTPISSSIYTSSNTTFKLITTPDNCNKVILQLGNGNNVKSMVFDNISLKKLDGWTVTNGTANGDTLTYNNTSGSDIVMATQTFEVIPNATYNLQSLITGGYKVKLEELDNASAVVKTTTATVDQSITMANTTKKLKVTALAPPNSNVSVNKISLSYQKPTNAIEVRNPNLVPLFSDSAWIKHANASVSADGKTLTLNATTNDQKNYIDFPVLPNNQYVLNYIATGNTRPQIDFKYNNIMVKSDFNKNYVKDTIANIIFTTTNNVNSIRLYLENGSSGAGIYVFSNIELRRKDA